MTKKRNLRLMMITNIALIMILCLSITLPAFAADYAEGTESVEAQAAITKRLDMPFGTTTPIATFNFVFEAKTVDGNAYVALPTPNMPTITDKPVKFDGSEKDLGSDGVKSVRRETTNIVAGITWPHAGVYVYRVKEEKNTYTTPSGANYTDTMTYSFAEYEIEVYVANKADGSGTYVKYIAAIIKTDEAGKDIEDGDKYDPTPGGGIDDKYSKVVFRNVYLKKTGGTDPEDSKDTVLDISKAVEGAMANQAKYFDFNVKITSPKVGVDPGAKYKAYVVEKVEGNNKVVTSTANGTIAGTSGTISYLEFTADSVQKVSLRHGQWLAFLDLPVGASFAVEEAAVAGYTPSYILTLNGVLGSKITGEEGKKLGFPSEEDASIKYIGELKNKADFINANKAVAPTGISVDNLPYMVLIAVALSALIGFAVVKYRWNVKQGA